MTTPHKATPKQWAWQEEWAREPHAGQDASCLLELRDRIALLEATQHAHADASRMSDAEREQFYAELAKPARVEALDAANSKSTPNPSQIRSSAAGDLMQSVGAAICSIADCGDTPSNWAPEARAAILAVAEWFDSIGYGATASILRQEVRRHG